MATRDVSHSELDAIRQCRLKHQLSYRELWQPRETARALSLGTRMHRILEIHYRQMAGIPFPDGGGKEPDLPQTIEACLYEVDGSQTEEQERCQWMWEGYQERYGDREAEWEIVDVEFQFQAWLRNAKGNRTSYRLNGTVDLLVKDWSTGGSLWGVDHKTISRRDLSKPLDKDLDFDDQNALYTWGMRERGQDVRGFIFNHVRSDQLVRDMTLEERFRRTVVTRTGTELGIMVREALETYQSAYSSVAPRGAKRGDRPPRSPDPDRCWWRCPFTEPCLMARKGTNLGGLLDDLEYHKGEPRY